jgi:signal transduction histidine kinase
MTLAHRLSTFFLVVLAVVLVSMCIGVPIAMRADLMRQMNLTLTNGLYTIVAATEFETDCVEWEPAEHNLVLEPGPLSQPIVWLLVDLHGRKVDGSTGETGQEVLQAAAEEYSLEAREVEPHQSKRGNWLVVQHWLAPKQLRSEVENRPGKNLRFAALQVCTAVDTTPVSAMMRRAAIGLIATSIVIWILAFLLGSRISRRVLQPITRLARLASQMKATDLTERLENVKTADELQTLTLSFNGLLDRLQESLERQRRFTGEAAHQLRTPLTAMRGNLEIALRRARSTEEYQAVLEKLHAQVLHLHDMVESLLFLARANDEAWLRQLQPVELGAWLVDYLAGWRQENPGVELLASTGDSHCWIQAQAILLGELVNIVLDNAVKYREPGTPISFELRRSHQSAAIVVANQGPPFTPQELEELFGPFQRSEHARRQGIEGLGLGLAIARRLAETFLGRITASTDGRGTIRFTIELPLTAPANESSHTLASSTP